MGSWRAAGVVTLSVLFTGIACATGQNLDGSDPNSNGFPLDGSLGTGGASVGGSGNASGTTTGVGGSTGGSTVVTTGGTGDVVGARWRLGRRRDRCGG